MTVLSGRWRCGAASRPLRRVGGRPPIRSSSVRAAWRNPTPGTGGHRRRERVPPCRESEIRPESHLGRAALSFGAALRYCSAREQRAEVRDRAARPAAQIRLPRHRDTGRGDPDEHRRPRRPRVIGRMHRGLARHPVALAAVARRAGGDDVLPRRRPAAAAGDHVVDGQPGGLAAAVLAGVGVASEHRLAGDLAPVHVARDADVANQPDHARAIELEPLGVQRPLPPLDHLGSRLEHEHGGAPDRADVDRFVARVEDQDPPAHPASAGRAGRDYLGVSEVLHHSRDCRAARASPPGMSGG